MKHKPLILFLIIGVALIFSAGCKKNKAPETPMKPDGPTIVGVAATNTYKTLAHDPNDDDIRYIFDWGDDVMDTTDYYPSDDTASAAHAWADTGTYEVKVRAQDKKDAVSEWSEAIEVMAKMNNPPNKPFTPFGPPYKLPNTKATFKTLVSDPDGDSVRARFYWGDGRSPKWTEWHASGDTIKDTITYSDTGTYSIRVVAQDALGDTSPLSEPFLFHVTDAWSEIIDEEFNSSPALAVSGNSVTGIIIGCTDGLVYCFDTLGLVLWTYPMVAEESFYSSPTIGADGTIYIGDDGGYVHAINSDGTEKWKYFAVGSPSFVSSSAIDESRNLIYFGSDSDTLYALNILDGSVAWRYGAMAEIISSPAIANDGAVVFGDEGDTGRIYILNPDDGSVRHIFLTAGPIYSSPTISGDKIYFGADTIFYALDTNAIDTLTYHINEEIYTSPTIGFNGVIYFGDENGKIYALNPDFTEVTSWPISITGDRSSSVTVGSDGLIYVLGGDDKLWAYNSDGNPVWDVMLSAFGSRKQVEFKSSPVLGPNGWIYAASEDGVYAFYRGATLATTPWPMFRHDIRHTGKAGAKR